MKSQTALQSGKAWLIAIFAVVITIATVLTPMGSASAADPVITGDQVEINETIGSNGFTHPGVGLTKATLETMRAEIQAQKEPWYSYYQAMTVSAAASTTVTSSNQSSADPTKPAVDYFNSQGVESKFIADGQKAYTQALMYYITGNETYRANAMRIIRLWSQMDPAKYAYYTDACIHAAIPLNRMVTAAEILRYTSNQTAALQWTDKDTADFTNNLITPVIDTFLHDQNHFMNQHNYPVLGAMAGYIFTDNRDRYNEVVEWWTVNKTAVDQGFNGSIKQLFRWVDTNALTGEKIDTPHVQHVEMGRDQAHGGGDLTNAAIVSRMLLAQGTKVDPVAGTVSTQADAVGPYEFLNDRILAAANYFWQYMLGYDTPWTPVAYSIAPDGTVRDTYNQLATGYRGRFNTANFWDLYAYYTYVKGINVAEKAPYYYEAFTKKLPSNFYYGEGLNINWDNVDGGGDFWLYLPKAAEADAAKYVPKSQTSPSLIEIEDRYTALDPHMTTMQEGGTSFVRFQATATGSKIALLGASSSKKTIGFKIRTNGVAQLEMTPGINDTMTLPDTKGQWRYVTYTMGDFQALGDLLYLKVKGSGTTVDVDQLNVQAGAQLTPPVFKAGNQDLNLFTYAGTTLNLDFSATDSNTADVVAYDSASMPQGAVLNASTGAFSWQPTQAGTHAFIIMASDGTVVTTKKVNLVVTADRASAVQAAIAPYQPSLVYVAASLQHYQAVYEGTMRQIDVLSDEAFNQQLQLLRSAAESLARVTPLLQIDGSIDYQNIVTSTFGTGIFNMVDGDNTTGVWYGAATNLSHILDFGSDYKISANSFGFQSNIFADRLAGSAVFGSNDGDTWTRLTSGLTAFTQSFQTLPVDEAYKNMKFRFIKIQELNPQPDIIHNTVQNFLEFAEFRIYGERYEIGNQLASVSIGSAQSVSGKIALGNTVKLTIKAKEAIQNVKVNIQGVEATVSTPDQINWTAVATLAGQIPTGTVKFAIDYQRNDGSNGDTTVLTTDSSKLFLVDRSTFIDVPMLATVTASDKQWPGTGLSKEQVGYLLFDGNTATYGDLNTTSGSYYTVDFGGDASVKLNEIVLMPRPGVSGRMNGLIIQGSNDKGSWTNLTEPLKGSTDGTWSDIRADQLLDHQYYRYLRLYNSSEWSGNVAEVEFYGDVDYSLAYVDAKVIGPDGYTKGSYYLYQKEVARIKTAMSKQGANKTALLGELTQAKGQLVSLSTIYTEKVAVTSSMVTSSSISWDNKVDAAVNGWHAFDGDPATFTDTKTSDGWILVDLGAGHEQTVGSIRFLPRVGNAYRMNGSTIQGSNNGTAFDTLYTFNGLTEVKWYEVVIGNNKAYRYLRYSAPTGSTNVAELEFYQNTKDKTLLTLLLQQAAAVHPNDYTEESLAALAAAADAAALTNGAAGATQADIDASAADLSASLEGLELRAANQLPVFDPVAPISVSAGSPVSFTVSATDADEDEVTYSAVSLPEGANFDAATGLFTWTPTTAGTFIATFKAVDSQAGEATLNVTITVTNAGIVSATLSGPGSVRVDKAVSLSVGVAGLETGFTTMDLIVHYDPSKLAFQTTTNEDGTLALDDSAVTSSREGFQVLGTGVKLEQGQIRIIMGSTGLDHAVTEAGEVLKLKGKAKADAEEGATTVSLSDFAVSDNGVQASVDTTLASITIQVTKVNDADLSTVIQEALSLHDTANEGAAAGQYPAGAKATLLAAIQAAQAVQDDNEATQAQLHAAMETLIAAVNTFKSSVNPATPAQADKAVLTAAILTAQGVYNLAVEGTKIGKYAVGSKATLQQAIVAAQSVRDRSSAAQSEVDQAVTALHEAVQAFSAKRITLVPGETKITIKVLSMIARNYGLKLGDANWSQMSAADLLDENEITIRSLAAVAQMIIGDWLKE